MSTKPLGSMAAVSHFHAAVRGMGPHIMSAKGSKDSGLEARIGAWYSGVRVVLRHEDGRDVVRVYRTAGSFGRDTAGEKLIAEFHADRAGGQPG